MNIITLGPRTLPFSSSIGLEEVVPFAACSPPGSLALQEAKRQCDQLTVDWSLWTMRKRQPHVPAEADFLRYFVIVIKWRHSCLRTQKNRLSERCKGTVASASSVELQWDVKLISHVQVHPPQFTWHLKVTQFLCQANFLGVFGHPPEKTPSTGTRVRALILQKVEKQWRSNVPKGNIVFISVYTVSKR